MCFLTVLCQKKNILYLRNIILYIYYIFVFLLVYLSFWCLFFCHNVIFLVFFNTFVASLGNETW